MYICFVFFYIFKYVCMQTHNLPTMDNVGNYLGSLRAVADFYVQHPSLVDIIVSFGLFLTNVNLQYLYGTHNGTVYTQAITKEFRYIYKANMRSIKRVNETSNTLSPPYREISTLFFNDTFWDVHMRAVTFTQQRNYSKTELKARYSNWNKYKHIQNLQNGTPNQYESNACLVSLAKYPLPKTDKILYCPLEKPCHNALRNGTNSGYSLSHRILWMALARFSRGCHILPKEENEQLQRNLCKMAYAETQYQAQNNYELPDLMSEFMCVCSLVGYGEHLQKNWMEVLLNSQTSLGCFNDGNEKLELYELAKDETKVCSHHVTALSVCTISNALRYILEKK